MLQTVSNDCKQFQTVANNFFITPDTKFSIVGGSPSREGHQGLPGPFLQATPEPFLTVFGIRGHLARLGAGLAQPLDRHRAAPTPHSGAQGALYPDFARIIPRKKRVFYLKFVEQVLGIRWFHCMCHDMPRPERNFRLFASMRV